MRGQVPKITRTKSAINNNQATGYVRAPRNSEVSAPSLRTESPHSLRTPGARGSASILKARDLSSGATNICTYKEKLTRTCVGHNWRPYARRRCTGETIVEGVNRAAARVTQRTRERRHRIHSGRDRTRGRVQQSRPGARAVGRNSCK